MRRVITTGIASSLLALALPAAASAHHHRHHHHAHRARTVVFAPAGTSGSTTTTPTAPTTPSSEGEAAGTIASYENGVLKITLSDGSTATGKVTEETQIQCGCPDHEGAQGDENGDGHDWGGEGNGSFGPGDHQGFQGDDEQGDQPQQESSCGVSSLTAGRKVKEAELKIGPSGAVWERIELFSEQK